jgi:hypothetical protein
MMAKRLSPVQFNARVAEPGQQGDWQVVKSYEDEGDGPWLVDLSHRQRWDYQHIDVGSQAPFGLRVPAQPGQVLLQRDHLITRMNGTQVSIWHLGQGQAEAAPQDVAYTDMSDAQCMLAVLGTGTQTVMECVCNLDLFDQQRTMPFLTQGPILHIPCQVVTLGPECLAMTFSRGYGQTVADALLHAASGSRLTPAGKNVFSQCFGLSS